MWRFLEETPKREKTAAVIFVLFLGLLSLTLALSMVLNPRTDFTDDKVGVIIRGPGVFAAAPLDLGITIGAAVFAFIFIRMGIRGILELRKGDFKMD
jgi:amino acid transporter